MRVDRGLGCGAKSSKSTLVMMIMMMMRYAMKASPKSSVPESYIIQYDVSVVGRRRARSFMKKPQRFYGGIEKFERNIVLGLLGSRFPRLKFWLHKSEVSWLEKKAEKNGKKKGKKGKRRKVYI
jgi:hypothetical protein